MCNRARNKAAYEPETIFGAKWVTPRPLDNRFNPIELYPADRMAVRGPVFPTRTSKA